MNATPLTSWIWLVLLVLLGPLDAWAAGEGEETPQAKAEQKNPQQEELDRRRKQQDAGARKLQDVAKKLHGVCSGSDKDGWDTPITDQELAKVTKELVVVLRDHDRPEGDKKAALQVLLYLGKTEDARKLASTVQDGDKIIAAHVAVSLDSGPDLEQARKNAEKIKPFDALPVLATKTPINKSDIKPLCTAYCFSATDDSKKKKDNISEKIKELTEAADKGRATRERLESAVTTLTRLEEEKISFIDICETRDDPNLARVAYAVDPVSVEQALAVIDAVVIDAVVKDPKGDREGEIQITDQNKGKKGSVRGLEATLVGLLPGPLGAITTAEGLTELAIRFATGLGKLAIDRAKQEAVLWALGEIGTRVCGNDGGRGIDLGTAGEIRTYWLPQLCDLTSEENLQSGFGAGQAMFAALVSAVENDAKNLPGAAAGLIAGLAYWSEDNANKTSAPIDFAFDCTSATDPSPECKRFKAVRLSTAKAIGGLLRGSDPVDEARAWSAAVDETNRVAKDSSQYVLEAPLAQLTACGVAVAAELGADASRRVVLDPSDTTLEPVPELYRVIGALASAPACWTLTGRGHFSADYRDHCSEGMSKNECKLPALAFKLPALAFKPPALVFKPPVLALDRAGGNDLERISTVIRLGQSLKGTQTKAGDAWRKLDQVVSRLRGARDRLSETVRATKTPDDSNSTVLAALAKLDKAELELEDLRALVDQAKIDKAKDRLSTALDVAEELLAATDSTAVLLQDLAEPDKIKISLFPGLLDETRNFPKWVDQVASSEAGLSKKIEAFRSKLANVQSLIDALRDVLAGDWAAASSKALAAAQALFPRSINTSSLDADKKKAIQDSIARIREELEKKSSSTSEDEALLGAVIGIDKLLSHTPTEAVRSREIVESGRRGLRQIILHLQSSADSKIEGQFLDIKTLEALHEYTPAPLAVTTQLGEVIGLFTAILSAKDSDDIAVVLEKSAAPPGGWRRKSVHGAFTVALGSHVGIFGAAEFRHGQYGVNRERGSLHGQAPTLSVPIGVDIAWGRKVHKHNQSFGIFVPIIDPAAFVQYDVQENGRLPGPRPLTVFSPGVFFRWGIFRTPFTLLVGYVYRPRLRTWEATINEPGADAHQLGVSIAIDATFWNIVKR